MDTLTSMVTALVAGADIALKASVQQAITDAYAGIKTIIRRSHSSVNLTALETNPASKARQAVLQEELEATHASQDEELLRAIKELLEAITLHATEVPPTIGINLEHIQAANLTIEHLLVTGPTATGVKATGLAITGDIRFSDITVHGDDAPSKKA